MRLIVYTLILAAAPIFLGGCRGSFLAIDLFVVDEKTALERQVLGAYEEIGRDLASYASMRAVEPDGSLIQPREMTGSQRDTVRAMNNRRYNRDDLDTMLAEGVVGEGRNGFLVWRTDSLPADFPLEEDLANQVFEEDNADRRTILERLWTTAPGATEEDREEIEFILAELNQDLAPAGSPIQSRDGEWSRK